MLTEIGEREADVLSKGEIAGRVRNQHLPAVPRRTDPRAAMDTDADVAFIGDQRISGVNAHPDPHLSAVRPRAPSERELAFTGRSERVARATEHDEETVAFGADLGSTVRSECLSEHPPVLFEDLRVPLGAEVPEQVRRSFDVGEQEGDGAALRPLQHLRMMA